MNTWAIVAISVAGAVCFMGLIGYLIERESKKKKKGPVYYELKDAFYLTWIEEGDGGKLFVVVRKRLRSLNNWDEIVRKEIP